MTTEEFKDWLRGNGWYIPAGGAIIALGICAIITLARECGSALLAALQKTSKARIYHGRTFGY